MTDISTVGIDYTAPYDAVQALKGGTVKVLIAIRPKGPLPGHERFVDELRAAFPAVAFVATSSPEEQMEVVRDADVIFGWPTRELLLAAERLRWVHCPGTGIDDLTRIPELAESDVVLTNARGPHANPMADHVIGMMISLTHQFGEMRDDQKAHRWRALSYWDQVELAGSTMGILSLGDIGAAVARRARGFDIEVYAVDKYPDQVRQRSGGVPPDGVGGVPPDGVKDVWGLERLDDLLGMSDWFVVTAPLTPETRGLIDKRRLALLRNGAYVVVISRGGIVDEAALADALRSGALAGAGIDAFAEEPLPDDSPLWDMDNVIVTPHASALTPQVWEGRNGIFKENLRRFLADEPFLYVCDKKAGF